MGKASRQRRLKQERERKQRRAAQPSASSPSSPSRPPPQAEQPSQRELAAVGVAEALHALAHGLQDQFMEWVEALAGQRQVPGWDATVSRELVSYLRVSVTGAWRHGWQPAELVRHAGRERGDSHARMAIDMIADEMRGYAAATVDERWLAQLSALRTEMWWGSDDAYLGRWHDREGDSPQATLITAVELLFVLGHLPVLPRLCPLPGTARCRGQAGRRGWRGAVAHPGVPPVVPHVLRHQDRRAAGWGYGGRGAPGGGRGARPEFAACARCPAPGRRRRGRGDVRRQRLISPDRPRKRLRRLVFRPGSRRHGGAARSPWGHRRIRLSAPLTQLAKRLYRHIPAHAATAGRLRGDARNRGRCGRVSAPPGAGDGRPG